MTSPSPTLILVDILYTRWLLGSQAVEVDPGRRNHGGAAQKCAVDGGRGDGGGHCVGGDAREPPLGVMVGYFLREMFGGFLQDGEDHDDLWLTFGNWRRCLRLQSKSTRMGYVEAIPW